MQTHTKKLNSNNPPHYIDGFHKFIFKMLIRILKVVHQICSLARFLPCSMRSWRYGEREIKFWRRSRQSERRSREENGERDFEIPLFLAALPLALEAPPPKLYFALAIPPATQARLPAVSLWIPIALVRLASYADILCARHAIFLPHERVLKPREYSLPFSVCSQPDQGFGLFPEDRPEIT